MKSNSCLDKWFRSISIQSYLALESDAHVIGRVDIALGPRSHIAGVEMEIYGDELGSTWSPGQLQEPSEIYYAEAQFLAYWTSA